MHARQAALLDKADHVIRDIHSTPRTAAAVLWQYVDPEGHEFYLTEKVTPVRSPYSGKTFMTRPVKHTIGQVSKELKEEGMM